MMKSNSNTGRSNLLKHSTWSETKDEARQLRSAVLALKEDNEDLRASALRWIRLYEAAVSRANELEARLRTDREPSVPPAGFHEP